MPKILTGRFRLIGKSEWVAVSAVYGPHTPTDQGLFLSHLENLKHMHQEQRWIIARDFNLISSRDEKKGGISREDPEMERFKDVLTDLRLVDIPTINGKLTWNNRRGGNKQIVSRLDRFLVSEHIIGMDIFYEASILPSIGSDHWPIKLEITMNNQNKKRPFRFESLWLRDPTFLDKVRNWWQESKMETKGQKKMHTFQLRLKGIKGKIKKWNREEFGNIQQERGKLHTRMAGIQQQIIEEGRSEELAEEEGRLINQLEERRKEGEIDKVYQHIPKKVTREQNLALLRVITKEEVEEVVNKMAKNKAPGLDGFTIEFYQAAWSFMGNDLLDLVEELRCTKRMHQGLNATFLALIPKNGNLDDPQGFRPISLCNVVYKILATILVNRLKPILPDLIAQEQTGFVKGKQITDGIIVAQEVIHSLKNTRNLGMLIKLDLAKVYDHLSWVYLEGIIKAYRFDARWVKWILSMGDPLSPFLFILAAEGLGRLVKAQVARDQLKGLRIYGNDILVTHQQFVDDVMLYGQATLKEAQQIVKILTEFTHASGTEINKEKSKIFFFNTQLAGQRFLACTMEFRIRTFPTKYLGIMLNEHQYRAANWEPLTKKIRNKMDNWTFRSLNAPSWLTLLKVVLQAIPLYQISSQSIPKSISQKLVAMFNTFLWQGTSKTRKWALLSWEWISKPTKDRGLGLMDPYVLNQVLGVKLWWRWTQGGQDLWKVIWERKYETTEEPEDKM
eukprot:PITA_15313